MQKQKILSALIRHPGSSVEDLVRLSGAKHNTVVSVVERADDVLEKVDAHSGGKGRPRYLYKVKPEWAQSFEKEWNWTESINRTDPLELTLRTMDSAAFAVIQEEGETQKRMRRTFERQTKVARSMAERADPIVRTGALARIKIALDRVAEHDARESRKSGTTRKPHRAVVPEILPALPVGYVPIPHIVPIAEQAALIGQWSNWAKRLRVSADQYQHTEIVGSEPAMN